jgi:hypothetical protein
VSKDTPLQKSLHEHFATGEQISLEILHAFDLEILHAFDNVPRRILPKFPACERVYFPALPLQLYDTLTFLIECFWSAVMLGIAGTLNDRPPLKKWLQRPATAITSALLGDDPAITARYALLEGFRQLCKR